MDKKTLRAIRFADKSAHSKYIPAHLRDAYAQWAATLRGETVKDPTLVTETRLQIPLSKYSQQGW